MHGHPHHISVFLPTDISSFLKNERSMQEHLHFMFPQYIESFMVILIKKKADYCHFQGDKDSIGFRADENLLVNKTKVASGEGDRWIRVTCYSNWILLPHLFLYFEKKGEKWGG